MAAANARRHAGDAAGFLLHPQAPVPTKNHMRENLRAMREKERANRGRKIMEGAAPAPELFRLKQFSDVRSRLHDVKPRPGSGSRIQSEPPGRRGNVTPSAPGSTAAVPAAAAIDAKVEEKAAEEEGEEVTLAEFEAQVEALKKKYGHLAPKDAPKEIKKDANGCPAYLRKIKQGIAEKEFQDKLARLGPDAPPGLRRLPAEEVSEMLAALKKKREEIEKEFRSLPLVIQTDSQKRREKAVKTKIEESDKAIKMFSAPVVYVPIGAA